MILARLLPLLPLILVGACIFYFQAAVSAVDLDGDGVDDLYAARYGVAGIDPGADPDRDGFSIFQESQFDTDPTDAGDRPMLTVESGAGLGLSWPSKLGVAYRPESSDDLSAWLPDGALRFGTGNVQGIPLGDPGALAKYFRLRAFPIDSDGDGLRDRDEEILGTDPVEADTDGDGLGDGFEAADPDLDPLVGNDPCADANGNGRPDIEDYAASLGAGLVSWIAPGDGSWHDADNWSSGAVPGPDDVVLIAPCSAG